MCPKNGPSNCCCVFYQAVKGSASVLMSFVNINLSSDFRSQLWSALLTMAPFEQSILMKFPDASYFILTGVYSEFQ